MMGAVHYVDASVPWLSAAELAALRLPRMPATKQGIQARAASENWMSPEREGQTWRRRKGQGGGFEFTPYVLPMEAQAELASQLHRKRQEEQAEAERADAAMGERHREDLWRRFDALPDTLKEKARRAHRIIEAVELMERSGTVKTIALMHVARQESVGVTTIHNWYRDIRGIDRCDWLAALAPHYAGAAKRAECSPEAWAALKADYLRLSQPRFTDCYRRLADKAKGSGWSIPSEKTLKRRMDQFPPQLITVCRKGEEALKRMFPAQVRDRSSFHAMEAVNADGHKFDVFVAWPEGGKVKILRPILVAFQDLRSGMILAWRLDISENKEAVRLAFGDMVERWGIPKMCFLDNGRNFASKWLTGGVENRYRFKVREDEPTGIMPQLGVEVHWTWPYSGQSKPIERAFRDFSQSIAKHPAFEGAYTGNNPMAKPENYGSKAVPLDEFIKVVAEGIDEHNNRAGRRSRVCGGTLSFAQAFAESYVHAPIKKATAEQRRLWLMAAESINVGRTDGSIMLEGNRFWADFLLPLRGQSVVVRFDPQALQEDLHVYRLDGTYLGAAQCLEPAGFADKSAAQADNRRRAEWMKAAKRMKAAELDMSLGQLQALYAPSATPDEPEDVIEAKVVRPIFSKSPVVVGNTALAHAAFADEDEDDLERAMAMERAARGYLRPVEDEEE
ncbi:transposase [Gluconacetobacter sacchari DSM 12717]|uniref:Transposase n=2 Tax=Gluconacetobacter sacchari TaxID=92759 RepID=A0A7W4IC22_9PROT|nr:transposase domain-containing protein [Gluconacetobacter sacchari]MBB2160116.1 transposase [Gluconacetobacter sacchari]GBQ25046.1 transposase [Gluconacetobacter sacchari DSM 12717]